MTEDGYVMRDGAEEDLQEHPSWPAVLLILLTIVLAFLTVTFEHDFI